LDVRVSVNDPATDAEINIIGFLNLMEAGRDNGLQKVIFASTGGAIYGEPEYVGQDEDHPIRPLSPYGITKLATEKYLDFYRHAYGIDHVCLRYANVYGPRQGLTGEAGVVAIFTQRLLRGETPIIYGDGQQTRDFTYVGDVVRANIAALDTKKIGVYNIGTGKETCINYLYKLLSSHIPISDKPRYEDSRPGEQMRSVLSYEKARRELGWSPRFSLSEGIAKTVDWFKDERKEASVSHF
jgi:UDP-glucose 4-epimerase